MVEEISANITPNIQFSFSYFLVFDMSLFTRTDIFSNNEDLNSQNFMYQEWTVLLVPGSSFLAKNVCNIE